MKRLNLVWFVLLGALLTGCGGFRSMVEIILISDDTLQKEVYGQQLRLGKIRTTIRAQVMVQLGDGNMYPNPGTTTPAFSSHRASFWGYDPRKVLAEGEKPKLEELYATVLQPLGYTDVYTFSQFMGYHTTLKYWWTDIYGKIQYRTVDVMIFPGHYDDKLPQFEIVLTENPGREPIKIYLPS